ncbi:MAG: hypothetical protein Q9201_005257 [Fulgogasparrea decipioides]
MTFAETPRTDAGTLTSMTNGYNIDDISAENTFLSPLKKENDLVSQLRNHRGVSLKTPRSRAPFGDRRNLPTAPGQGEFTPLLKSVAKKNLQRSGRRNGVAETPAFLKQDYDGASSPALPARTPGGYSENTGSSFGTTDDGTPVPQVASSSTQATPLATLPKRNAEGVLADQGNVLTLREQENIINKIEKENFGLKLKIHFLEESLRKSGPGLNQAALKENNDLKVDRIIMQKELARARKTLDKTEREVEDYRQQLQNAHDSMRRKHTDKKISEELESLRKEIATKNSRIQQLHDDVNQVAEKEAEIEKLRGDIDDLELDLREKDRLLDDREDELESLREQAKRDSEQMADALHEVASSKERVQQLEQDQQADADRSGQLHDVNAELAHAQREIQDLERKVERAEVEARSAQEGAHEAQQAKQKAEEDLEELRNEMFNKSINSKGHSRQLEEKSYKLQTELAELRNKGSKAEEEAKRQKSRLKDENDALRQRLESIDQKCSSLTTQLHEATKNLQRKSEEKDLLHSRHDALTTESQSLQEDLMRSQARIKALEEDLDTERSHALENDRQLREEAQNELRHLSDELDSLQRELEDKDSQHAAEQDLWESQRRGLESERDRANEQSVGLQRTINKLQEVEGSLSGKEHKLQEALESEKQRHEDQQASLKRDIEELDADISDKRKQLADLRSELARTNEELRVSKRNEVTLEEKAQALEDEVNVLQDSLDEEAARAKEESTRARQDAESLRRQLQSTKQELSRAEASLADVRAELEHHQGDVKTGRGSQDQLNSRLHNVESELRQVKAEKQSLQDKLANNNLELHELRSLLEDAETERDEIKSQLKHVEGQTDRTFTRDQEKSDLKKAKFKLELEVSRLREERIALAERNEAVEHEIQEEVQRASVEEGRLTDEIAELKRRTHATSDGRDRELTTARDRIRRLERQVQELEDRAGHDHDSSRADTELALLHKDLAAARKKDTEFLQREAAQREAVKDLKLKVTFLERQLHEAELSRLAVDSPKSSVGGSARKAEIAELRNQLSEAHQQLKDVRSKSRETEKELRRKLGAAEREAQMNMANSEQQYEQLEQEISSLRHEQESEQSKLASADKTISRLRSRIQDLESSLRQAWSNTAGDRTIADERKDLHEMLKDAKLEAEDLQLQISTGESNLRAAATREEELRTHLQRVRSERTQQQQKSSALVTELDHLQSRYERAVENLAWQQKQWEAERKAMNSRVRFPNMSISEDHGKEEVKEVQLAVQEQEQRHANEINGMAYQIRWLRWKLEREADFRHCLVFEKVYLSTQIKMFEACNKLDLVMFKKKFGIDVAATDPEPPRKRHIKTYAFMIVFWLRCKRYADEWTEQKKVKGMLNRALEEARRGQLMKRIEAAGRR